MSTVVEHLQELLMLVPLSETTYRPTPKESLSTRETQLFWRYHGHFPNEFARAIVESLPENQTFVHYDHLSNVVSVEVA